MPIDVEAVLAGPAPGLIGLPAVAPDLAEAFGSPEPRPYNPAGNRFPRLRGEVPDPGSVARFVPATGMTGVERLTRQLSGAAHDALLPGGHQGETVGLVEAPEQDVAQIDEDSVDQILVATKPDLAVGTWPRRNLDDPIPAAQGKRRRSSVWLRAFGERVLLNARGSLSKTSAAPLTR